MVICRRSMAVMAFLLLLPRVETNAAGFSSKHFSNEIGINTYAIMGRQLDIDAFPVDSHQTFTKGSLVRGVFYKHYFKTMTVRSSFYYCSFHPIPDSSSGELYSKSKKYDDCAFGVGIEKGVSIVRYVVPYAALDFETDFIHYENEHDGGFVYNPKYTTTEKSSFGASPVIGCRFDLPFNLSLSVETSVNINYSFEKIHWEEKSVWNQSQNTYKDFWEIRFNSVKLINISYKF